MKKITIGKYHGLQRCSSKNQALSILALDHRNNLRNALSPDDPSSTTDEEMISFKKDVLTTIAESSSSVLLDPEFGLAQSIQSGSLPAHIGLIATLEETGYTGEQTDRNSKVLPGWGVNKAKWMGADAVKLLVYYHPKAHSAPEIESLVQNIGEECTEYDIPFFLEVLTYSLDPSGKKLSPKEKRNAIIESARILTPMGVDILKAEFPGDITKSTNVTDWMEACLELTRSSAVPWVLLSASVSFDVYLDQTRAACQAGASGVAAGRAVWQEAPALRGIERLNFLNGQGKSRMMELTKLCDELAHPWTTSFSLLEPRTNWYATYDALS